VGGGSHDQLVLPCHQATILETTHGAVICDAFPSKKMNVFVTNCAVGAPSGQVRATRASIRTVGFDYAARI